MSIKEIKDVKKIQEMLKDEMELRKYTYECCIKAGKELAKNSFAWDGKEKNLVVQAMELNKKYEQAGQKLERIRDICLHEVKELTDSAIHGGRYVEISQIIDEVK